MIAIAFVPVANNAILLSMALKVHLHLKPASGFLDELEPRLDEGVVFTCGETLPSPPDYEILVCGVPDKQEIEASPDLKQLVIPWAGLPIKTREIMAGYPNIAVHNLHHNAVPVAEMAITLMMALAKDLIATDAAMRKDDWGPRYATGIIRLLAGKRVLIVGYGAVGREIASRCGALGMTVSALRRKEAGSDNDINIYPSMRFGELLAETDVVFLSLPLTLDTKGMIGVSQLSQLPDGAIVINISRGDIIDERALYDALKSGRIKAGLDVWYNYPRLEQSGTTASPSDYAFRELPNVVMTPHLAGHSDRTEYLRAVELARLLNMASRGEPMPNRVDLDRGY